MNRLDSYVFLLYCEPIQPKLETLVVFPFEKVDCRTKKDTAEAHWRATVFRRYTFPAPCYAVSILTLPVNVGQAESEEGCIEKIASSGHERRMVGRGFFKCVDYCPKLSSREGHHQSVKYKQGS